MAITHRVRRLRLGHIAVVAAVAITLAACGGSDAAPTAGPSSSASQSPTAGPTGTATPTPTPTPTPDPTPDPTPVVQGTSRGSVIFVQQFGDASLVAGGEPIRLTLTQTGAQVSWFSAPRQRLTGAMRTESMLRLMGWQPSSDGTTSPLPPRAPNALLSSEDGTVTMQVKRASIRGDGTLVLDIEPIGPSPETTPAFGRGSLVLDGVAGVRSFMTDLADGLRVRTLVLGRRAQLALVQVFDSGGTVLGEYVLTPSFPTVDTGRLESGDVAITDAVLTLRTPQPGDPGFVALRGTVQVRGEDVPMNVSLARWTVPRRSAIR